MKPAWQIAQEGRRMNNRQLFAGYLPGYVFFTHVPGVITDGIDWFERYASSGKLPPVSHTGVVLNSQDCIEAHWANGVQVARLAKYLADPATRIYFRRPRGYTDALGGRIAAAAFSRQGEAYDKGLILSQLASNTFVGHLLNKWFNGRPEAWLSARLDGKQEMICSELSAWALNEQPEFRYKGVLSLPLDTISPQELFEDPGLWEVPQ